MGRLPAVVSLILIFSWVIDAKTGPSLTLGQWTQLSKLTVAGASGLAPVATTRGGDVMVLGAPGTTVGSNPFQGIAYVFIKPAKGWSSTTPAAATLTASDGAANDGFGNFVSISGDTIVVGAQNASYPHGAAYLFVKPTTGWANITEKAKLVASDGASIFGFSVSVSGSTVVVGALNMQHQPGAAYVFVKPVSGWTNMTETARFNASDPNPNDSFGASVAVSGNTAVVGGGEGRVHVFVKPANGWVNMTETAKLTSLNGAGVFGYVAINGNTIVSQGGDPSVYVFVKPVNGWADATETAMLTARRGQRKNHFGFSVALTSNLIAVGAPFQDAPGVANAGAVYVYVKPITGWKTVDVANARLRASDGGVGAGLGFYVTVSGNTVAAGAPNAGGPGAVYIFGR